MLANASKNAFGVAARQAARRAVPSAPRYGAAGRGCRCWCGLPLLRTIILFGSSWCHSSAPLVPSISIHRSFSRPWRDLRGGDGAQRAVLEADDGGAVVVERAARRRTSSSWQRDLLGQQAGDEAAEVVGVRADVAEAAGGAGAASGRCASSACFWSLAFEPRAQPALDVEGADGVDLAQLAGQDHLAGLADQRVAGVVVRDGEDDAGLLDDLRPAPRPGPGRTSSACRR